MKNIEILELSELLSHYAKNLKDLKGAKFAYTIIKNIDIINKESKDIKEVKKISEKYKNLEKLRLELCEKFADKDEKDMPLKKELSKNVFEYVIIKNKDEFNEEVSKLMKDNEDAIKEQETFDKEYSDFLNEESIIEFRKIDLSEVPDEINIELFDVIKKFIKDND